LITVIEHAEEDGERKKKIRSRKVADATMKRSNENRAE